MANKLISFDDTKPGLGLPDPVENALGGAFAERARATEGLPLTDVTVTPRGTNPIPTEFFDGSFWGVQINEIHRSTDGGLTWEHVTTVPDMGNLQRVIPTADGEMLAVATTEVKRSTGWGTSNITWVTVLTNPTPSFFYPWGVSGDGQKFIIVHYSGSGVATPDRADSRYGWISTDAGQTWNTVWDVVEQWDEDVNQRTHIHAAEYDPWEDRFFIAEGHEEVTGVYVSYDDGGTWDKITYGPSFDNPPGNSPTVIKATDYGIVFGSDDPTNGVMVMPRGTHEIQRAYSRRGVSNTILMGYAHMGARDPRTGMVYLVWELNSANAGDIGAQIMASDGRVAGPVWEDTNPSRYLWRRIAINDQGTLLAWEQGTNSILRATIPGIGVIPGHMQDTGRVMGGRANGGRGAVAVGPEARAEGNNTVAIGGGRTSGHGGVAIGSASVINNGVAIGESATADANGMAVGGNASTVNGFSAGMSAASHHSTSTAFGREAEARVAAGTANTSSTAVGWRAKATASAGSVTAVGAEAKAPNNRSTALGAGASAEGSSNGTAVGQGASVSTAINGTAVGQGTTVSHGNSVALGQASATTSTYQVHVGPRHIEATPPATAPLAPTAGARVYTRVMEGKTQLVVQFPTGGPVVLAEEL